MRPARPTVLVTHVRHGPGRGARLGRVDRTVNDGRVRVPGYARAGDGGRDRAQSQDRGMHWSEEATMAV